jgi:hypothetical protein
MVNGTDPGLDPPCADTGLAADCLDAVSDHRPSATRETSPRSIIVSATEAPRSQAEAENSTPGGADHINAGLRPVAESHPNVPGQVGDRDESGVAMKVFVA